MRTPISTGQRPISTTAHLIRSGAPRNKPAPASSSIRGTWWGKSACRNTGCRGSSGMPAETSLAICSMMFGGVFDRFPKLRVAFAHGGGAFPFTAGRVEHAFAVRPDLCAIDSKTSPAELPGSGQRTGPFLCRFPRPRSEALRYLIRLFGAERIALGSDYPFPLGEEKAGALIEGMAGLPPQVRAQLLAGTCQEFLGLE